MGDYSAGTIRSLFPAAPRGLSMVQQMEAQLFETNKDKEPEDKRPKPMT